MESKSRADARSSGSAPLGAVTALPAWRARRGDLSRTNGIPCPDCGERSGVIDSRFEAGRIRRRRCCVVCGRRFTTAEIVIEDDGPEFVKPQAFSLTFNVTWDALGNPRFVAHGSIAPDVPEADEASVSERSSHTGGPA